MLFARESNSRAHSLTACSSLCPDWLPTLIKKTIRREKKRVWNYLNNKQQTSLVSPYAQCCVVMGSNLWWRLSYTETSLSVLPFSILHRRQMPTNVSSGSFLTSFFIFFHPFCDTVTWEWVIGGILVTLRVNKKIEIYWFFTLSLTLQK